MKNDPRQYILFIFLIILCGYLLYITNSDIENKTIEQINNEQIIHAKQAESNINSFFDNYNSSLFFLAGNSHIISRDHEGDEMMRNYYQTHRNDISSITRVDEHGVIVYSYPNTTSSGTNISQQAHVQKVIRTQSKVIGDIFTSVQGFHSVAFHVPVFSGTQYNGSIALLIPFEILTKKSLEKIQVMKTGYSYAVSRNGIILYSPFPDQVNRPAREVFADYPSLLAFLEKATADREGTGTYQYSPPSSREEDIQKYHAIYRSVDVGDQSWTIIVATPEREIFSSLQDFTRDLAIVSTILVITLIIFAFFFAKAAGIVREEEKRKKVESALRESEKNYRMIIDSIQDVFYRTDKEGNLLMISPSGVSLLGYDSYEEIIGRNVAESFYNSPEERINLEHALQTCGSVNNFNVALITKSGSIIYGQTSSHLYYNERDEVMGIEGIFHDSTCEKMTGAALQQALKKLNLLNAVTFSDIQNAVFCLTGYLEILRGMSEGTDQEQILEKEETLTRTILHSLNFAKDYQGLGLKPPAWQNLEQSFLFGISHTDLSPYERNIQVKNIEVFADPLLEKVFYILADNVLLHSMTARNLNLHYGVTGKALIIRFEDDGTGIPAREKEQIFERGSGREKGTGLFLAREILGITGISIRENGIPGEGARFEITFPPGTFRFSESYNPV